MAHTSTNPPALPHLSVGRIAEDAPIYFYAGLFCAALCVPFWLASGLDARLLDGANIWAKPQKFAIALSVYLLTLAYFARFASATFNRSIINRVFQGVVVFCILGEMIWIGGAAMWGTRSHFNVETPMMEGLYMVMGLFAVVLTTASLVLGIAILRHSTAGMSLAIGSALIATFFATLVVAGYLSNNGGHFVGGDAARLLPFMGWARDVGDLRVPHFFATHIMHFAPVLALAFTALGIQSRAMMVAPTAIMAVLVASTFAQALSASPFLPWLG